MALQLKLDSTGVETGAARAKSAIDSIAAAASKAEAATGPMFGPLNKGAAQALQQFNALRSSLDPVYAATVRYASAVELVDDALRMQAITQQEAAHAVGLAKAQFDRATESAIGVSRATDDVGKASQRGTGGIRNLGLQLNQIAQVGGMTGNWMNAIAMQLPDILLGFGTLGIFAGVAAGAMIPLVSSLFNMKSATDDVTTANDAFAESFSALQSDMSAATTLQNEYVQAVVSGNTLIIAAVKAEAAARDALLKLNMLDADASQKAAQQKLIDAVVAQQAAKAAVDATEAYRASLEANPVGDQASQAQALEDNNVQLELQKKTLEDITAEVSRGSAEYNVTGAQLDLLKAKLAANGDLLASIADGTAKLPDGVKAATNWADQLAGWLSGSATSATTVSNANMAGNIASAAGQAQSLAGYLSAAASAASAAAANRISTMVPTSAGFLATQYGAYGQGHSAMDAATDPLYNPPAVPKIVSGGGGGGGGGGASAVDQTAASYDRLLASLDPVVAKSQDMAKATETADAALAHHDITAAEHAHAMDLIRQKYEDVGGAAQALKDVGGNALDSLIDGTKNLSEALKQMAKDLIFATLKAELLQHVTGGTSGMSIGSLIISGITGGFHDTGGTIPQGTTGMVGERGPELVTAGRNGAVVTSRVDTARMMQAVTSAGTAPQRAQAQAIRVSVDVGVTMDDDGKMQAYVRKVGHAAASAGASQAVQSVKRSLSTWNTQLATDGALA